LLASLGAFPILFGISLAYATPPFILLVKYRLDLKLLRFRSLVGPVMVGFLVGLIYWVLVDMFVPLYPANTKKIFLKAACYLAVGAGFGVAFGYLWFEKKNKTH
jgi:hypothetical protein